MIFELDDDLLGFCKGDKIGTVPVMSDSEAGRAARDAWLAEISGESRPAQGATEGGG